MSRDCENFEMENLVGKLKIVTKLTKNPKKMIFPSEQTKLILNFPKIKLGQIHQKIEKNK